MKLFARAALAATLLFAPVAASALGIAGGDTRVSFSSALNGLDVGLTGSATLVGGAPGLTVNFNITGGDLDPGTLAGSILHEGSGLSLSNGTNTLGLGNFIIDTSQSLLLGDVTLNGELLGSDLSLFSFDLGTVTVPQLLDLSNPLLELRITATAAGALSSAFGLPDTTGVVIGNAATAPSFVPEPASWALLITGFGAIGAVTRRRRALVAAA